MNSDKLDSPYRLKAWLQLAALPLGGLALLLLVSVFALRGRSPVPVLPASQKEQMFHISKQPMFDALSEYSEQAGLQLLYSPEIVDGLEAPAVEGELSDTEALESLLSGSGLKYRMTGKTTVTIEKATAPVR